MKALTKVNEIVVSGLIQAFEARVATSLKRDDVLDRAIKTKKLRPGQRVVLAGEICTDVFWVERGLLSLVFRKSDGTERIRDFVSEGQITASLECLENGLPASLDVVAYEHTTLQMLDYRLLAPYFQRDLQWSQCRALFFHDTAINRGIRERDFLTLTPSQRFFSIASQRPEIINRVSQHDLAAFIGITPESLSRLKARASGPETGRRPSLHTRRTDGMTED